MLSKNFLKSVKAMQTAMSQMVEKINEVSRMIQPYLKSMKMMQANIIPVMKQIEVIQRSFIPLFTSADFAKLQQKAKEMKTPAFKKFIKEWGWLINKKSISFGDYCYALYQKYGNNKFKDKINRWVYYKSNLDIILKDIKLKYPTRYPIIKEAFDFHIKRKYVFSITLLLPQTEGILWELSMKRNLVKKGYNSTKKKGNVGEWSIGELSKR